MFEMDVTRKGSSGKRYYERFPDVIRLKKQKMAERKRFELLIQFPVYALSRGAPSASSDTSPCKEHRPCKSGLITYPAQACQAKSPEKHGILPRAPKRGANNTPAARDKTYVWRGNRAQFVLLLQEVLTKLCEQIVLVDGFSCMVVHSGRQTAVDIFLENIRRHRNDGNTLRLR